MSNSSVYEYSIIRLVPNVLRGECMNVGVIMYCRDHKFLKIHWRLDQERFHSFVPSGKSENNIPSFTEVKAYLMVWEKITAGMAAGGPIAQLDPVSRFRWLTAPRSSIIQPSPLHPGLCVDPEATLNSLFEQYVL